VPYDFGRDVFKTLAFFAANLALGLPAVRTNFFLRLDPLGDRLQHFGGGLPAGTRLGLLGFDPHQHLLRRGGFGGRRKEREQNLFLGEPLIGLPLRGGTVEFLLQLPHAPVQLLNQRMRLRQCGGR